MGLDFYHHICNTCFKIPSGVQGEAPTKFRSCSSCKLVSYCCRSHQKADWKQHKTLCREVNRLLRVRRCSSLFSCLEGPTNQSLYDYQTRLTETLEIRLERNLTFSERSMIFFPDICGQCLQPNGSAHISCSRCQMQFYCCPAHKDDDSEAHERDCESLKLCFELFKFLSFNANCPPSKCTLRVVAPPYEFPDSMEDYFLKFIESASISIFDKVIYSDILSYILTIVYVLRQCMDVNRRSKLNIHILGATHLEIYILNILENFFLWFEALKSLHLLFVGPECPILDESYSNSILDKHSDRNLNIVFKPGLLYHDFISTCQGSCRPDVLVAFNCGFHEFRGLECDTWKETIDCILTMDVVLLTTSYTLREALEDSSSFIGVKNVGKLKLCEKNPFRSLNPHRNPERSESTVYFFNQFLSVFHLNYSNSTQCVYSTSSDLHD